MKTGRHAHTNVRLEPEEVAASHNDSLSREYFRFERQEIRLSPSAGLSARAENSTKE
jgi:hypothetical protein